MALKSVGNTGTRFLQLLELRLDSVVYKLGFATTRAQARQFVTHGHILLNGKKHNIPSTILKPGDEIEIKSTIMDSTIMKEILSFNKAYKVPTWLKPLSKGGVVVSEPTRDEIDPTIRERLIIELYSR
jgi:small subunit ribosomal protein S4